MCRFALEIASGAVFIGPPGTGKTRHMRRAAAERPETMGIEISLDRTAGVEPSAIKALVDEHLVPGRLVCVDEISSTWSRVAFAGLPSGYGPPVGYDCENDEARLDRRLVVATYDAQRAESVLRLCDDLATRFIFVPCPTYELDQFVDDAARVLGIAGTSDAWSQDPVGFPGEDEILGDLRVLFESHQPSRMSLRRVAPYVRCAKHAEPDADYSEILAEAYLLAVGPRLARLSDAALDQLEQHHVNGGVLPPAQWEWIRKQLEGFLRFESARTG